MTRTCGTVLVLVIGASPASGQSARESVVRGSFNAVVQTDAAGLSQSITLTKNFETAPIAAELSPARVPAFDGGVAVRLLGNVAIGLSVSRATTSADAEVSAQIPHVFFFNQRRAISGTARVEHKELATHLSGAYVIASREVDLALLGGISLFSVDKDFVADVAYTETYPFDTASFTQAELRREHASKAGYHVAADVTWKIARHWGAGGLVRYSRAKARFSAATLEVGGLQAGAGLRVRFW